MLISGTHLGPYEILGKLGAGGMGEVYRARDSKLKREVAVKVLPDEFSRDRERVARFQREAEVLASLNHPQIASIYEFGESGTERFLVLELVDGETLSGRMARGPLPVPEALRIAKQIAEALEAAHARGITHRDLKPANVKIAPDGRVKLLDFGLAKVFEPESASSSMSQSPTVVSGTIPGVILGTAGYMSPEQARGQPAGNQSDIWSFGVVLYEMLTGKKAFSGDTIADVLAGVLRADPDWDALPKTTPALIRMLLRQCLHKNRAARLHHIADARIGIEIALNDPSLGQTAAERQAGRRGRPLIWVGVNVVLLLIAGLAIAPFAREYFRLKSTNPGSVRFSIPPPENASFGTGPTAPYLSISPDGKSLVFIAQSDGSDQFRLWLRSLDAVEALPIPGSEGVSSLGSPAPFWSPDSQSIAFFSQARLKRISVSGGTAFTICDGDGSSGSWNRNGVIIFDIGTGPGTPLQRVAAAGGKPEPATALNPARHEIGHRYPFFLPDGDHFLFLAITDPIDESAIMVGSLSSQDVRFVVNARSRMAYDRSGYVLYAREASLMALPFDATKLRVTDDPFQIADHVRYNEGSGAAPIAVSDNGVLAYRTVGGDVDDSVLTWLDRSGKTLGTVGAPAIYSHPELSPDARRIAVERTDPQTQNQDIWIIDALRGTLNRLTSDPGTDRFPVWSSAGDRIFFTGIRNQNFGIYAKASNGLEAEQLVLSSQAEVFDVAPEDQALIYGPLGVVQELSILPLSGDRKPSIYLPPSNFLKNLAQISPNGRWVAYASNESGRDEVYIQSYPVPATQWRVSANGATAPRWRGDGRELFYVSIDQKLTSVAIQARVTGMEISSPVELFEVRNPQRGLGNRQYDVTADGQRFLVNLRTAESAAPPITVITNWTASLKK
jgi:serine/threonine protein kinase